ncbi:hypothetical protein [Actinomadura rubrisoli]|uniref:hypothetical protein n=1 Tax=Actinomadura rubrisoli TaxID=2530368 RepID=UPI0014049D67|nr:hypothetical protein [Actinomadura rubrisoli]
MDLLDWAGTLLRRWWLTLPLLLVALAGAGAVAVVTPWTYEAKASAVLLASPFQAKSAGGNPWLVFDSSLTVTAEVVGREMMDERTAAALRAKGLTATYVVGVAPDSTGPVLAIDVSGDDPRVTKATLDALLATVPERLARLQSQEAVSPRAQIKMNVISASPKASLVATDKIRTVVMVLFLGLVIAVAVPLFAEVLAERRRRLQGRVRADARAPREPPREPVREPVREPQRLPDVPEAVTPEVSGGPEPEGAVEKRDAPEASGSPLVTMPDTPRPRKPGAPRRVPLSKPVHKVKTPADGPSGGSPGGSSSSKGSNGSNGSKGTKRNGSRAQGPSEMSEPDA